MEGRMDFDRMAQNYDDLTSQIGVEEILESIGTLTGKPNTEIHLLDAGCGTASYSLKLLEAGIGKISVFDASEKMLEVARNKLDRHREGNRIGDIKHGVLPTIPFEDGCVDVVMINMVLHHLNVKDEDERTKAISITLQESKRVLKQDGIILIMTCFPEQYYGYWYTNIAPEVAARKAVFFRSRECFSRLLADNGFSNIEFIKILGSGWGRSYCDPEGPLKEEWRNTDTYWSLFTKEELEIALQRVEEMKSAGTLHQFMLDNDKSMTDGNMVLIRGIKQ